MVNQCCAAEKPGGFRADIHIHSDYSHDSTSTISEIYQAALEKGMDVVCITDHCDIYPGHDVQALLEYRKQVVEGIAQKIQGFSGVEILTGVELGGGFIEPGIARAVISSQPYDLVIGSVHGIMFRGQRMSTSKFDFGSVDQETMLEYLDGYMDAAIYIAEKMNVDVLAHLTYIFRYINGKYKKNLDWRIQEDKIRRVFRALIARGIALEINTSCVGSSYDEWLPAKEIIDLYIEMGGKLFTFGSDAHKSEKIGNEFEAVKNYLRQKGIRYLVYYKNRVPHQYSI